MILELSEKKEQINDKQKEIRSKKHAMIASDKSNYDSGDGVINKTTIQKEGKIVEKSDKFSTKNAQHKDFSQPDRTTKTINPSSTLTSPASSDKIGTMTKEENCSSYKSNKNDTKQKSL